MDVSVTIEKCVPAGVSLPYRGGVVPFGFLLENGDEVDKVFYGRLYEAIGDTHGIASNGDKFKLPDSRGRTDIGAGQGAGLTNRLLAATGGEESHILTIAEMPSHNHDINDPGHNHDIANRNQSNMSNDSDSRHTIDYDGTKKTGTSATGITIQNKGGGAAHNNMPPFIVATKMIKF